MAKRTWHQDRAAQIEKDLRYEYGHGWFRLSDEQRGALIAEKVLMLVMGQMGDEFKPAADMARAVLREIHPMFKPETENA